MPKSKRQRRRQRKRGPRAPRAKSSQPAPQPQVPPATPKRHRKDLSREQALAAQLMQARNRIQVLHAELGRREDQIVALKKEVYQAEVNAEARENALLAREQGLPNAFHLDRDEKGWYIETDKPVEIAQTETEDVQIPDPEAVQEELEDTVAEGGEEAAA